LGIGVTYIIRDGASQEDSTSELTHFLSESTFGRIVLSVMAAVLFLVSIAWGIQLIRRTFVKETVDKRKIQNSPRWLQRFVYVTAYIGTSGRIILFILLAVLLCRVAWDPDIQDLGFGGALAQIQTRGVGMAFLFLVGLSLIIFGIWSVFGAYYHNFFPEKPLSNPTLELPPISSAQTPIQNNSLRIEKTLEIHIHTGRFPEGIAHPA